MVLINLAKAYVQHQLLKVYCLCLLLMCWHCTDLNAPDQNTVHTVTNLSTFTIVVSLHTCNTFVYNMNLYLAKKNQVSPLL